MTRSKPEQPAPAAAQDAPTDGPRIGPGKAHYTIRILPNGEVVFGDLPAGLAEVARALVRSGDDSEPESPADDRG